MRHKPTHRNALLNFGAWPQVASGNAPQPNRCHRTAEFRSVSQTTLVKTFVDALGHMGGPGDGFGRRRSSGHVRAAAETPAAVSAADAAGAGPELGCAGQLERAAEAPIDEASSLWVGLSVDRSVGRSGLVGICIWCCLLYTSPSPRD